MTRILIIDDHEAALHELQALLSGHGYAVDTARDGAGALGMARRQPPHLAIGDLLVPMGDGYTLLGHWKEDERLQEVPFLVYTATHTEPDDESLALSLGADGFLVKPSAPAVLLTRIRQLESRANRLETASTPAVGGGEKEPRTGGGETLAHPFPQSTRQLAAANRVLRRNLVRRLLGERENPELLAREPAARRAAEAARTDYRSLFENAPGCYLVLTPEDLEIVAVSDAYLRATMTTREQLLGRRLFEVFPDDPGDPAADGTSNLRASLERVKTLRRADTMPVQRYSIPRPESAGGGFEERFWSPVNTPVPGPDGAPAYLIHRVEDVTEFVRFKRETGRGEEARRILNSRVELIEADIVLRGHELKRANEQLEQSTLLLRIAGRTAHLGGWALELPAMKLFWSDEIRAIHETPPGFTPALTEAIEFYPPDQRPKVQQAVEACMTAGTPFDFEMPLITAKGRQIWVRAIGEAVRDEQGRISRLQGAFQDISEQKAAHAEARHLAARLTTTLESITDAFFTLDHDWCFTFLNREAERLLRRSREELLGRNMWTEFPAAVGTLFEQQYRQAVATGESLAFEAHYPPLDAWFSVHAFPSSEGLAVYFRDVTATRQAGVALRESEERFRLLAKATNDAVWDWNLQTDQVWWNEGIEVLFGHPRNQLDPTSKSWTDYIHPDDLDWVLRDVHEVIEGKADEWTGEYRFRHQNGEYIYVLDRGHVLRDPAGKAVRMIGGMTDLTERKEAEQRIAEQAALLDIAHEAILVKDLEDGIIYWNKGAERTYGWTAGEAVGRKSRELFQPDPAKFEAALTVLRETGEWRGELEKRNKAGQLLTIEVGWTLVRDGQGRPKSILAINTDITERRKIESQFLRAQRMESIGTLAGGIAHDLNNVLAPIMVSLELLRLDERDPERLSLLKGLEDSAQRGADLIRQVLSFARGIEGERMLTNLQHLARELRQIIRDTFPKNIEFRLESANDLWQVAADPTQMHQVMMNLCVNARDAMPEGGRLTLGLRNIVVDDVYAGMNPGAQPGPHVTLTVADTGTGIPAPIRERIFDPFFTTKEAGKGTGLGLATVLTIVKSHGGFVNLYSEPGQGTKFKVYLPAGATPESAERTAVAQTRLPLGRGELVLVVDDEEGIRVATQKTLERFGYRVMVAVHGAEAVALYAQHGAEIAVVLTDMAMPVMDGLATILALKAMNPAVKIIGSSGHASNGGVAKAVGAGVQHFVPKPYTAETMLKVLADVLAKPA